MSRQYPELRDVIYLTDWAADKVLQMTQKVQPINFKEISDFSRSVAIFLCVSEGAFDNSENWLNHRFSDILYILDNMRHCEKNDEKFTQSENKLIDLLNYILEYYEENGYSDRNMISISADSKVWKPPSRWIIDNSESLDLFE